MEQSELEALVGELETRVERLRSLYDQYFMGIEKLEPLVPKKDVERRLNVLRKEQIKNTGLRFKFQMIVQRYNTFITYWMRTSRAIEEGRYKRDVIRARRRFGIDPTREGVGDAVPKERPEAKVVEIPEEAEEEYEVEASFDLDVDEEGPSLPPPRTAPGKAEPAPSTRSFGAPSSIDLDDLGDPFEEVDPFPKPRDAPTAPKIRLAPRAVDIRDSEPRVSVVPARPAIRLSERAPGSNERPPLTRPGLGPDAATDSAVRPAGAPAIARRAPTPDAALEAQSVPRRPGTLPSASSLGIRVPPPRGNHVGQIRMPAASQPGASVPVPGPTQANSPSIRVSPAAASAGRPVQAPAVRAPQPSAPAIGVAAAPAESQSPSPTAPRRPATLPSAGAPSLRAGPLAPPQAPPSAAGPSSPQSLAPAAVRPAEPTGASVPPRTRVALRPSAKNIGDLSDTRFGEIYTQYVETRRKQNEPTGAITREALAKQLAGSTERLKEKHAGKSVDFEVVVKDGKTILRPVVK